MDALAVKETYTASPRGRLDPLRLARGHPQPFLTASAQRGRAYRPIVVASSPGWLAGREFTEMWRALFRLGVAVTVVRQDGGLVEPSDVHDFYGALENSPQPVDVPGSLLALAPGSLRLGWPRREIDANCLCREVVTIVAEASRVHRVAGESLFAGTFAEALALGDEAWGKLTQAHITLPRSEDGSAGGELFLPRGSRLRLLQVEGGAKPDLDRDGATRLIVPNLPRLQYLKVYQANVTLTYQEDFLVLSGEHAQVSMRLGPWGYCQGTPYRRMKTTLKEICPGQSADESGMPFPEPQEA